MQPRPAIDRCASRCGARPQEPTLNPTSRDPLNLRFANTSLRDLLNFIGSATGINVTYDRDFQDRSVTVQLEGVTLEQALQQVMLSNQIFYKVLNERTIIVATDNTAKRQQYEEQVIKTFFVSHADATELAQLVNTVILAPQMAIQPRIAANKTANTITVRASAPVVEIIEQIIRINDKPRAEVVIDVQILEVSRERAKRYGLNLTDYAIGAIFSPEQSPGRPAAAAAALGGTGEQRAAYHRDRHSAVRRQLGDDLQRQHHLHTGSAPPTSTWRCRRRSSASSRATRRPRSVAKPQLRGQEGQKVTLNLGEEVPVPSTTFTPLGRRRRRRQPADLVHLPADRRHRRDDPARHLRGRHRHGPDGGEQRPRPGLGHRRPDPAGLRVAQGDDPAAAARRRVEPAGRSAARGRAAVAARVPGHPARAASCSSCSPTTTPTSGRPTS